MVNFSTKIASTVSVVALLATTLSASVVSAASEFLPYAEALADYDVISAQSTEAGYRLGDNITRAELAKVAANLGGYIPTDCDGVYADVTASLGDLCGYIEALEEAGVVMSATNFRPTALVTRAEMVKMLLGVVGEEGSSTDAGYMDVAGLGDLTGYINRANELGCARSAAYFRPNATSSRGEAFKIAACVAGIEMDVTEPTTPVDPTTPTTPTTGGALSAALDGAAMAQYVPKNASSVKVGTVKLSATTADVTVQSLVVARSGLGNANDIQSSNGIRAAVGGVVVSSSADFYNATSQKGTVYFSPALVVKAGSSVNVDVLVNLSGAENSQHQFTLEAVNASSATVTGTPITLGLLNTTSYVTATTTADLVSAGGTVTAGKSNQLFAKIDVAAGGRETRVAGFTLTRSGSTDFTKRLQNVKAYRNGVEVGTVSMTAEKLGVVGLSDVLAAGNTQTYELRGDILVDATSTVLGLKFDSTTDVSAIETTTGYSTMVSFGTDAININFGAVEFTFAKQSTGNVTLAPGSNNVKVFDGRLSSSTPVSVRQITITPALTGNASATGFVNDQLSVKLNGAEIATLTSLSGPQVRTVSFVVDATTPAVLTVEGSIKNNANVAPASYQFTVALTEVRDSSNNTIGSLGAGSSLTGDRTTVATAEVELRNATVAAPSTSRIYSSAEQEIGRFALTARNETARVQSIVVTNVDSADLQTIANSTSSAKLVDVATNAEISATVTIASNTITFSNMNDTIAKDTTKNYRVVLGVTSIDDYYGEGVQLTIAPANITVVRDSNSTAVTPTGSATMKEYVLGTVAPTVAVTAVNENVFRVRVTNPDTNTGITIDSATFDFRTALPGNTTYAATACLRDLGSTNTCGAATGVSTGTGAVPSLGTAIAVTGLTTNMTADRNGGFVEFEVYITSANLLPVGGQLQVSLTQLDYTVGASTDSETYVGTTGATATFTK